MWGRGRLDSLIKVNRNHYGIPQGAPISNLIANLYLLDFDCKMASYARKCRGYYLRYSDDILLIVPGDGRAGRAAREYAQRLMRQQGEQLFIKPEKCQSVRFKISRDHLVSFEVGKRRNSRGLEYLGFRFDGESIFIRNSTISNLRRRMRRSVRARARALVARYRGKDLNFLSEAFDVDLFLLRFGRVPDFELNRDYKKWTFWTYAKRAAVTFGERGDGIYRQLSRNRDLVRRWLDQDLATFMACQKAEKDRQEGAGVRGGVRRGASLGAA